MRNAIAAIPPGQYAAELSADGYDQPIQIRVTITATGDSLHVDYTGSPPKTLTSSINCVLNVTYAHTIFPFKASLVPELPNNEGLFRPISVEAPLGSMFNARFPAAVRTRSKASYHMHNAIYRALSEVLSDRIQAGSGSFWAMNCHGEDAAGQRLAAHLLPNGGGGRSTALTGRRRWRSPATERSPPSRSSKTTCHCR